ncbi:MAG TPA: tRNA pseudouridine(55) synthase TruB [Thermoanaerobaculia bacterium]|nr:tRNA pseudouridine(55) synthase TruB [Thermoanaerobaculia bacterium]
MDGLLLIDKEPGLTSHDVVQKVRRLTRQKKTGHCGTLDPNATGLLLLTLGKATRLTRFLIRAPKVYQGVIRFGAATDTYDSTGEVVAEAPTTGLTQEAVVAAMARFVGTIEHAAPPYSAKKVQGKKLYELARAGKEVPTETKEVTVYEFRPLDGQAGELANDRIAFRLACASGTYARTLAHELGRALGCGAHLEALRRIQIGPFELEAALTTGELGQKLEERSAADGEPHGEGLDRRFEQVLGAAWVPFDRIPLPFGEITADHQQEERVRHGQTVLVRDLEGDEGDWIKLMNRRDELIAVGTVVERIGERGVGIVQPRVVFT